MATLVKSDRTALLSIGQSEYNQWVADRLAEYVCEFVKNAYVENEPNRTLALLVPFENRKTHPVAEAIWNYISRAVHKKLPLANVDGCSCLFIDDARLISVSVGVDYARRILEGTPLRKNLVHHSFDLDDDARKALSELGCNNIRDEDLLQAIAAYAEEKVADEEWIWLCWEWMAAWISKKPYGEDHRKRLERVKQMPIVPVGGQLHTLNSLAGRILTWHVDRKKQKLPEWLPLVFVEDWFRDRGCSSTSDAIVEKLLKEVGIAEPGEDILQRAVGQAIEQYWKKPDDRPERFLEYILDQNWNETFRQRKDLQRCPVSVRRSGIQNIEWIEARAAYFGFGWHNDILKELYSDNEDVPWVHSFDSSATKKKQRDVLTWLGVADRPRVIDDSAQQEDEKFRISQYLPRHTSLGQIPVPKSLENIDFQRLDSAQAVILIKLLARSWDNYYRHHCMVSVEYQYYSWHTHYVTSAWWEKTRKYLKVPMKNFDHGLPLTDCWLPEKRTERDIGDLLPIIDIAAFGNDADVVRDWLINVVGLRTYTAQLTMEEWENLLNKRIPELATPISVASNTRLRDKVAGWYEACLETIADQDDKFKNAFINCLLLFRKADLWNYVSKEPRYLADDHEFDKAFRQDIWILDIPSRLRAAVEKYFGVSSLSQSVQVEIVLEEPGIPLEGDLKARYNETLPYVFAWRSAQTKQDTDKLRARLTSLKVEIVQSLTARLVLNNASTTIDRFFAMRDSCLFLREDHVNETTLAQALADELGVKTEADFYENLLRCNEEVQRKEKLLAKGCQESEVDRFLRDFAGMPQTEVPPAQRPQVVPPTVVPPQPPPERPIQPPPPSINPPEVIPPEPPLPPVPPKPSDTIQLKDPLIAEYVVGPHSTQVGHPGGGGGGGGGRELSQEEKINIELCGRRFARRDLEKTGYKVEEMPLENPGFDIRASKTNEELHVEVKAHLGRASVVEVTHREYQEYFRSKQGVYTWELWNVDYLGQDEHHRVTITKYTQIPREAIEPLVFRLDLKKCRATTIHED